MEEKVFNLQSTFLSKRQLDEHKKLYKGYVDKVNQITTDLAGSASRDKANATESYYRELKKGESFALNGVILHEKYFQLLGVEKSEPKEVTTKIFNDFFDGYENWKKDFLACALSARGWVVFAFEQRTQAYRNILLDRHDEGFICGAYPLIILDMYEHAYFIDYGTDKAKYINGFLDAIRWDVVEKAALILKR